MQIVSLLVIIPFLLEPASSLVLPAIPDACTHVSPSDRGDVRCGRLTQIQVDNPTRSWWTKPAIGGNQGQNLSARAPGKKKNSDKNKDKDKDKDKDKNKSSKSKGKPKKSSSEATAEKPGGSSSEAPAEKAEGSSPEAPAEKPKESSPGAPTQGTKDSSSGASAEKPGDSSSGAPAEKPEDSSSGTPAEKPEGSSPGSPEQDKGQFSIPDRTKPQQQGDDQTGATENQPGQKPDKGKGKATDNSDEGKPAGVDQKAEGGEQKPQSDEKKQGGDVPLDPNRKNQEGVQDGTSKKDDKTMYNIVTPNPNESKGITSIEDEETSYYRKIGDGNANAKGRYGTHNPHFSAVQSHGQEAKQNGNGRRPGKVEEMATTGAPKPEKDSKKDKGAGLTEWYKITPKKQNELGDSKKTAWTDEDLRKNLVEQQQNFKNHKAGDKDDKYGKLTQDMLDMCKTEQCRKGQAPPVPDVITRAIIDKPLLRRRLESLLQERDELFEIAMRR